MEKRVHRISDKEPPRPKPLPPPRFKLEKPVAPRKVVQRPKAQQLIYPDELIARCKALHALGWTIQGLSAATGVKWKTIRDWTCEKRNPHVLPDTAFGAKVVALLRGEPVQCGHENLQTS